MLLESADSRVPEVDKVDTDKAKAVSILASHKRRCDVLGLSLNASKSVAKRVLVVKCGRKDSHSKWKMRPAKSLSHPVDVFLLYQIYVERCLE